MKGDDSVMSGTSIDSFGVNAMKQSLVDPMDSEDMGEGSVKIITEMKLYFKKVAM